MWPLTAATAASPLLRAATPVLVVTVRASLIS